MIYFIDDKNQHQIEITDLWRTWLLPKFAIDMEVSGDYVNIYWSDTQSGTGGRNRELSIHYLDVVDGYSGYLSNPASAAALMEDIEEMIVSGFTNAGGAVLTAKADLLSHDGISDAIVPGGPDRNLVGYDSVTSTGITSYTPNQVLANAGGVVGPGSSVNNRIATFSGVTGKIIQDSGYLATDFVPKPAVSTQVSDYTIALTDSWDHFNVDNAGLFVTVTIPTNTTAAFEIGTYIWVTQVGVAQVNIEGAVGVTVQSPATYTATRLRYSTIRLQKTATNTWQIAEDVGAFTGYDANATTYFNAQAALGTPFTSVNKGYINTLFLSLKATGSLYTKTRQLLVFIGTTYTEIKLNAVNPVDSDAAHRVVATNSPTYSNNVTFNGTTNYLDLKYNGATSYPASQNDNAVYIDFSTVGVKSNWGALDGGFAGNLLSINNGGTGYYTISRGLNTFAVPATKTGGWLVNRTTSTSNNLRQNDVSTSTDVSASSVYVSLTEILGGRNGNGTPNDLSADTVRFYWRGQSLTAAEATALFNANVALNTSLGR